MAKSSGKVSSSFTGVPDIRPKPSEKPSGKVDFGCGMERIKADPLGASFDSRPRVTDNNTASNRWVKPGGAGEVDAGRKSHSFGPGPAKKESDRY